MHNAIETLCLICRCVFVVDVSLPEVSREDLPPRVQEFLRRDDEKFESQLQEQNEEQVLFCCLVKRHRVDTGH